MSEAAFSWDLVRLIGVSVLMYLGFGVYREIKKTEAPQVKRKLIIIYSTVAVIGIGLYVAITQLGAGDTLWVQ